MENNLRITQLKLSNYRNHKFLQINPTKNIILISGKNGAGKTNVLESISLFDSNTGFRNAKLSELVRYDLIGPKELFGVNLKVYTDNKIFDLGFGLKGESNLIKKVISIDKRKTSLVFKFATKVFKKLSKKFSKNRQRNRQWMNH